MSQDDVELVRKLYEHWERGDYAGGGELYHPDLQFARIGAEFGDLAGEWQGVADAYAAGASYLSAWEGMRQAPERFIDLGDRVLVLDKQIGRGRGSGVEVEHEIAFLFTVRDGRIVRVDGYWDRADALREAGLDADGA